MRTKKNFYLQNMNFLNFRAKEMKTSKMTHVEMKDFSGKTNETKNERGRRKRKK